jgi:hypothetical protein
MGKQIFHLSRADAVVVERKIDVSPIAFLKG